MDRSLGAPSDVRPVGGPDEPRSIRSSRANLSLLVLRLTLGGIWTLNLLYIIVPGNQFFPTFASTARSFGPSSLGGQALTEFVAGHTWFFATMIAEVTAYLAVAFLLGLTTRLACLIGAVFNFLLLITQFGTITTFPGATDVGPQPLYLAFYLVLFIGSGEGGCSLDRWLSMPRSSAGTSGLLARAARRRLVSRLAPRSAGRFRAVIHRGSTDGGTSPHRSLLGSRAQGGIGSPLRDRERSSRRASSQGDAQSVIEAG